MRDIFETRPVLMESQCRPHADTLALCVSGWLGPHLLFCWLVLPCVCAGRGHLFSRGTDVCYVCVNVGCWPAWLPTLPPPHPRASRVPPTRGHRRMPRPHPQAATARQGETASSTVANVFCRVWEFGLREFTTLQKWCRALLAVSVPNRVGLLVCLRRSSWC